MSVARRHTSITARILLAASVAFTTLAACSTRAPELQLYSMTTNMHDTGPTARASARSSPIVELRQYTLHAHRRDDLMTMFDSAFIEPQEAVGITVIGQFRNLDDPNKFVWLRGFPTMEVRTRALGEFYGGPAWRSRRTAANETIIDNDNVLLLRPVGPDGGFALGDEPRSGRVSGEAGRGMVVATIYHLDPTDAKEREFIEFFQRDVTPLLAAAGAPVVASFVPERAANGFPRLPVREGEHVFVWFARFPSGEAYEQYQRALAGMPLWRDSVGVELSARVREPYVLRLSPTTRSRLHG